MDKIIKVYGPLILIILLLSLIVVIFLRNWKDLKNYDYQEMVTEDSVKLTTDYNSIDKLLSYKLFIKFTEKGCTKEAYEVDDFRPELRFFWFTEGSFGVGGEEIKLENPTRISDDSLKFIGLEYAGFAHMYQERYRRIYHFEIYMEFDFLRRYSKEIPFPFF